MRDWEKGSRNLASSGREWACLPALGCAPHSELWAGLDVWATEPWAGAGPAPRDAVPGLIMSNLTTHYLETSRGMSAETRGQCHQSHVSFSSQSEQRWLPSGFVCHNHTIIWSSSTGHRHGVRLNLSLISLSLCNIWQSWQQQWLPWLPNDHLATWDLMPAPARVFPPLWCLASEVTSDDKHLVPSWRCLEPPLLWQCYCYSLFVSNKLQVPRSRLCRHCRSSIRARYKLWQIMMVDDIWN